MGCYVNIEGQDKFDWLLANGNKEWMWVPPLPTPMDGVLKPYEDYCHDDMLPVIVADNGPFTSAGIAYNKREWDAFTRKDDGRLRFCFTVDIKKLKEVSDLEEYLERG